VRSALERGKHVVTANKALLAAREEEIFRLARHNGVDVGGPRRDPERGAAFSSDLAGGS
jgi:uncharacterized NAD-dependent epimerase/dehydratase family protein